MPWITEAPQRDIRRLIRPGVAMANRYWTDNESPHKYQEAFFLADNAPGAVTITPNGWALVTYRKRKDGYELSRPFELHWAPSEIIAVVTHTGDDMGDRLILPGGYLCAHKGTAWRVWTAFHRHPSGDHTLLCDGVSVAEGRAAIARSYALT